MNINNLDLYNYEVQNIYISDNILRGYEYLYTHTEYKVLCSKEIGQHYFNKIGVCLKYLNSNFLKNQEEAKSRLDKAIQKLLAKKLICFIPLETDNSEKTCEPSSPCKRYYAVRVGRQTGIFSSWKDASAQVLDFPNNVFKSFYNLKDAEDFLK